MRNHSPGSGNSFSTRRRAYTRRKVRQTSVITLGPVPKGAPALYTFAPAFPELPGRAVPPEKMKEKKQMVSKATAELQRGPRVYYLDPENLVVVGVDTKVKPGEHPLLKTKGELDRLSASLDEGMIESILVAGVRKPIFARRNGSTIEVADGRRRVLHAREVNRRIRAKKAKGDLVKIKVLLQQTNDEQTFALSRLDNRHHMEETPLQTAEAAAIMVEKMPEDQVAAFLGVQVPMLHVYLALNRAAPELRSAVEKGEVSITAVSKLVNLPREEQVSSYKKLLEEGGGKITVAQTSAVRARHTSKKNGNGNGHNVVVAPPKRVLGKLLEKEEVRKEVDVPKGFWEGVEFALGRKNPKTIAGMTAAITAVTSRKKSAEA